MGKPLIGPRDTALPAAPAAPLSAEQVGMMIHYLYGEAPGWQRRASVALGVRGSTVRRWLVHGTAASPATVALQLLVASRQASTGRESDG